MVTKVRSTLDISEIAAERARGGQAIIKTDDHCREVAWLTQEPRIERPRLPDRSFAV
jgi:hypothetical protein